MLLLVGRYAILVVLLIEVRGLDVKDFSRDLLLRDLLSFRFNRGVVVVGYGVNPVCSSQCCFCDCGIALTIVRYDTVVLLYHF